MGSLVQAHPEAQKPEEARAFALYVLSHSGASRLFASLLTFRALGGAKTQRVVSPDSTCRVARNNVPCKAMRHAAFWHTLSACLFRLKESPVAQWRAIIKNLLSAVVPQILLFRDLLFLIDLFLFAFGLAGSARGAVEVVVEGRGVSSDTLKANMRALFGGVNLLYKKV